MCIIAIHKTGAFEHMQITSLTTFTNLISPLPFPLAIIRSLHDVSSQTIDPYFD